MWAAWVPSPGASVEGGRPPPPPLESSSVGRAAHVDSRSLLFGVAGRSWGSGCCLDAPGWSVSSSVGLTWTGLHTFLPTWPVIGVVARPCCAAAALSLHLSPYIRSGLRGQDVLPIELGVYDGVCFWLPGLTVCCCQIEARTPFFSAIVHSWMWTKVTQKSSGSSMDLGPVTTMVKMTCADRHDGGNPEAGVAQGARRMWLDKHRGVE